MQFQNNFKQWKSYKPQESESDLMNRFYTLKKKKLKKQSELRILFYFLPLNTDIEMYIQSFIGTQSKNNGMYYVPGGNSVF